MSDIAWCSTKTDVFDAVQILMYILLQTMSKLDTWLDSESALYVKTFVTFSIGLHANE